MIDYVYFVQYCLIFTKRSMFLGIALQTVICLSSDKLLLKTAFPGCTGTLWFSKQEKRFVDRGNDEVFDKDYRDDNHFVTAV